MKIFIFLMFYIVLNVSFVYSKETIIDNVFAVVNNQVILNSDIDKLSFLLKYEGINANTSMDKIVLRKKIIDKLILDALLIDSANQMNIEVTDEQVKNTIKQIALQKNITVSQLKNNILFNDNNTLFTYDDYLENIKKQLKIQLLQDYELHKRINISEKEINLFLYKKLVKNNRNNNINISYILLPFSEKNTPIIIKNKKIVAHNIMKKMKNGYSFFSLYNKCMQNKTFFSVRHIPSIKFLDLQKMFSHVLNIVKKGDILGPFLEKKGLYILKINDIKNKKEKMTTELHMQHCLIKFSPIIDRNTAKKKIFKIYHDLKNGIYSFNYSVKNFSDDIYLYNKKGDLGWISYELFDANFQKIFFTLKNNSISPPMESKIGWHIFKLLDKRHVDQYYEIERNKIYRILFNRKAIVERKNWIHELQRLSYIHITHT